MPEYHDLNDKQILNSRRITRTINIHGVHDAGLSLVSNLEGNINQSGNGI